MDQTKILIDTLPVLFQEHHIQMLLDIPCGDFHWMMNVDLDGIAYIGADIVKDLVQKNKAHERPGVEFYHLDLLQDDLPQVDLVLCRDCLVHLSYSQISAAINNICRSNTSFLLTTTFPGRTSNRDITTGDWRPINLEISPFNFPKPVQLIREQCSEEGGLYDDKSLGLWRINEIRGLMND